MGVKTIWLEINRCLQPFPLTIHNYLIEINFDWLTSTYTCMCDTKCPKFNQLYYDDYVFSVSEEELQFPQDYPVGCLLGCVDVVDCLAQEDYREQARNSIIL